MATYLLDTVTLIYVRNGVGNVRARLDEASIGNRIITGTLVVGELVYGAECSARRDENLRAIEAQLAMLAEIVPATDAITRRFGRVKAELRRRGIAKSDVDLLIAATALEIGARLVTSDEGLLGLGARPDATDLSDVPLPDLSVENWV